ncbi:transposase IS3 family, ORF_A [Nitritalea halalkaliphila LW7]|uniref:Transposase IS3 family, ORF_A n=1 Tax=Nitritalea halalkaliphila LW7 TaxID=1189621 RepID=I5C3H4_9BACT|nr:transposase [Nitritalea halalkaliphila]EIM76376.1 transposase IS3 family, ORF_A [Nitritalea halalkaliphila LW7]
MKKRTFSKEEKLKVLEEAKSNGVQATLDKYGVYPATYYSWKKKYETMGEKGFRHGMTPAHLKEIKRLEKENELLKKLLAEKEIESHLKDDLLKKKYPWANGKN